MKRCTLLIIMATLFCVSAAAAQNLPQIAVYVTGDMPENERKALGTRMLATLVNSGRYIGIERSNSFLAEIDKEQAKQRSGAIDDGQISRLGRQFGLKYICIADITPAFGEFQVSARIVNVETAVVVLIGEAYGQLKSMNDLSVVSDRVVENMFGGKTSVGRKTAGPEAKRPDFRDDKINIEMVFVNGGTFKMGRNSATVNDYYIGKYEVTQQQWIQIMGSGNNPSKFKGGNLPVERVSFNDVQEFILRLNEKTGNKYRLPTEAEWEFAARGGNKGIGYTYSGSNNIDNVAWYYKNSEEKTHPVGTKLANELGIHDMSGNVWEWTDEEKPEDEEPEGEKPEVGRRRENLPVRITAAASAPRKPTSRGPRR